MLELPLWPYQTAGFGYKGWIEIDPNHLTDGEPALAGHAVETLQLPDFDHATFKRCRDSEQPVERPRDATALTQAHKIRIRSRRRGMAAEL